MDSDNFLRNCIWRQNSRREIVKELQPKKLIHPLTEPIIRRNMSLNNDLLTYHLGEVIERKGIDVKKWNSGLKIENVENISIKSQITHNCFISAWNLITPRNIFSSFCLDLCEFRWILLISTFRNSNLSLNSVVRANRNLQIPKNNMLEFK